MVMSETLTVFKIEPQPNLIALHEANQLQTIDEKSLSSQANIV
jgi:hypothetical protein